MCLNIIFNMFNGITKATNEFNYSIYKNILLIL